MPFPQKISDITAYQQSHDSIFSRVIYRRLSKVATFYLIRFFPRIAAPDVTIISFVIGIVGAIGLLSPSWWGRIVAFVCIQLSFVFDCSDGEIARMLNRGSKFGIWFDSASDRAKEILWFMAVAYQLYMNASPAPVPITPSALLTGDVGGSTVVMYLAFAAIVGNLLVGYFREAKKSIFLSERKPEIIVRPGLHIGTVDMITFLLSWGVLFHLEYYVLWLVAVSAPLLLLKQIISTYRQSEKPNRTSI